MTSPMRVASSALVALAIAVAGCGGGGGGGGETLSKSEFQTKANAICKQFNDDVDKLGAPSNFQEIPAFTDKAIALSDNALDKLDDLKPPKEFQDDWNQWLAYGSQLDRPADGPEGGAEKKDEGG